MKKYLLIAVPAIAVLASCAKNEVYTPETDPQQITFQAVVSRQGTKAMINGTTYPTDVPFGTYAFFLEKGKEWAPTTGTSAAADAQIYIPQSEVKNNGQTSGYAWTTATAYYWPKQGSLTFFSYSPYLAALNAATTCDVTNGIKISNWDVDANQTVDVMVADYRPDENHNQTNAGYNGVPTVFRHKLSQIVAFNFKTDKDYTNGHTEANAKAGDKFFYINSVKINNILYKGTYTSTNKVDGSTTTPVLGAWVATSDKKGYTWYDNTTGTAFGSTAVAAPCAITNGYILVLPQTFTEPAELDDVTGNENIQITYTIKTCNGDGFTTETVKDVYASIWAIQGGVDEGSTVTAATPWAMNKKISYTITIGLDQIYWAPSAVDWETQGFEYKINM